MDFLQSRAYLDYVKLKEKFIFARTKRCDMRLESKSLYDDNDNAVTETTLEKTSKRQKSKSAHKRNETWFLTIILFFLYSFEGHGGGQWSFNL